jgi:signal transduction histidine kinase
MPGIRISDTITFETEQGLGTCFIVRLPLKSDEDELEAEDSE